MFYLKNTNLQIIDSYPYSIHMGREAHKVYRSLINSPNGGEAGYIMQSRKSPKVISTLF